MAKHTFEYDDETRQISGPGHLVNEVWKLVADAAVNEHNRVTRWHETYNAALQVPDDSLEYLDLNSPAQMQEVTQQMAKAHILATLQANLAHGPLKGGA